jgi:phosphate:Na+ symporter
MNKKLNTLFVILWAFLSIGYANQDAVVLQPAKNLNSQIIDDVVFGNIELEQYVSGFQIIWNEKSRIQPFYGKYAMVCKFAEKPEDGSLLEPKWKLSKVKPITDELIYFVQGFNPGKTYLIQLGVLEANKVADEITERDVKWWSTESTFKTSAIFGNFNLRPAEGKILVEWTLDYEILPQLDEYGVVVAYNTAIGEKRNKSGYAGSDWVISEVLPIHTLNYEIDNLLDAENYVVKIGLVKIDSSLVEPIWSSKSKTETDRSWGVIRLLILIGSLGLFIYGMKVMSEGLQQTAGARLRNWLRSMTSNRFKGVLTGFGITSIVQSSSVTTVMTVSFVNAGLMTLRESAGVMMGANIGTTITAWLVLLVGFKVSIDSYSLVLIALVFPLLFVNRGKAKALSQAVIGFSILFMGLSFLKSSVPELDENSGIVQFFTEYRDPTFFNRILFVLLGTLVTVIVQSSSAAMTLTMTLVAKGIIPFEVAAAMILGENIGTTITAELASLVGNVHAKRSARIHTLFNLIGVGWMIFIFPFFLDFVGWIVSLIGDGSWDPRNTEQANEGLAVLHTSFNALNVLLLIWFVPQLVALAERTVKSKGKIDEEFRLEFIGTNIVDTPEISIYEAKKEVAKFGEITSRMSRFTRTLLVDPDKKVFKNHLEKIEKYEEITDRVEIEVAKYLNKVSEGELTEQNSSEIRGLNSITNDLERIGDIFYQMSKTIEKKADDKIWFSPEQREGLLEMLDLIDEAFEVMVDNLKSEKNQVNMARAIELEDMINKKRDELRSGHLDNMESAEYNIKSGMIYNDLFSSCEKVGDHIINVSEAVAGKI